MWSASTADDLALTTLLFARFQALRSVSTLASSAEAMSATRQPARLRTSFSGSGRNGTGRSEGGDALPRRQVLIAEGEDLGAKAARVLALTERVGVEEPTSSLERRSFPGSRRRKAEQRRVRDGGTGCNPHRDRRRKAARRSCAAFPRPPLARAPAERQGVRAGSTRLPGKFQDCRPFLVAHRRDGEARLSDQLHLR